jgi:hypothetical protein
LLVSPNGRWLLAFTKQDGIQWTLTELEGKRAMKGRRRGADSWPDAVWFHDSRRWAEVAVKPKRIVTWICDADYPERVKKREFLQTQSSGITLGTTLEDHVIIWLDPMPGRDARYVELDLSGRGEHSREYRVLMPAHAVQTALSPEGHRLAWTSISTWDALMKSDWQWNWFVRRIPCYKVEVWVGYLTGGEPVSIGHWFIRPSEEPTVGLSLRWMPDGKQVSIMRNEAVWTLPVRRAHSND